MGRYHDTRQRLRAMVQAQLRHEPPATGQPDSSALDELLCHRSNELLDEFESLTVKRDYWRGVWQSFWGSMIFSAVIGLLYIVGLGAQHTLGEAIARWFPEKSPPSAETQGR